MRKQQNQKTRMNEAAVDLFDEMLEMEEILKGKMFEDKQGITILDLGIDVDGGFIAGEYLTQLCMGGLAEVSLKLHHYSSNLFLPSISVITDFPVEATLGSQYAGWAINKEGYHAMASGPARILAKKPKKIYEQIGLEEKNDETVVVLEASSFPPEKVQQYILQRCDIPPDGLCVAIAPIKSLAGSTQISGRSIETALHKLYNLGFDLQTIQSACGTAPIAPLNKESEEIMMGRTNDMLIYGSEVFLQIDYKNDEKLQDYMKKAISSSSESYGSLFQETFKKAQGDFYNIDPALFAPAKLIINNVHTGSLFSVGQINTEMIERSIETR